MDKTKKQYIEQIKKMLTKFSNIDYAFIFGSATKDLLPESDVDILIGGEMSFSERADLAIELEAILKRQIDIVLTKKAPAELVLKAFSQGVAIVINDKKSLEKDYFDNFYLCEDRKGLRKLRTARVKRRYSYGR